jgi:hypothetical protein
MLEKGGDQWSAALFCSCIWSSEEGEGEKQGACYLQ